MRIGTVAYCTRQGLGRLAKSFYDHGVITDVLLIRHRHYENHLHWYPPETPFVNHRSITGPAVDDFLGRIDILLCFETPFDWNLLPLCKGRGVKTVLVPMYEWTLKNPPTWFDKVISPSLLDQRYFPDSAFLPVPVETKYWKLRTRAEHWLHNAGHVGHREHKGTRELIQACRFVKSDWSLHVYGQDGALGRIERDEAWILDNERVACIYPDSRPYERLWEGYDVYIAPEKLNGLSLPLQEARAAGMLVVTTDRFPHNTWLPKWPLVPVKEYRKACISNGYLEFDEAVVDPVDIAAKVDELYGMDITEYSLSGLEWAKGHSWKSLKPLWMKELEK